MFQTGFFGLPYLIGIKYKKPNPSLDLEARGSPFETKGSPSENKRSPWKPENNNRRTIEARDNNRFELREGLIEISKREGS